VCTTKHPLYDLTERIIGALIRVHRELGPGLLESLYQGALAVELRRSGVAFVSQPAILVNYLGEPIGELKPDFIVEGLVVVELKSVRRLEPIFHAQVLIYMKVTGVNVGLLVNMHAPTVIAGLKRFVL
jgi:GxxExxY protein